MNNLEKKENIEINIYLDESGSCHNIKTKWFIVGGVIDISPNLKVKSLFKKFENNQKNITQNVSDEFKGSNCEFEIKKNLWIESEDKKIYKCGIIFDKLQNTFQNQYNNKIKENVIFNYLVAILVEKSIQKLIIDNNWKNKKIILNVSCDNRTQCVATLKNLESYLKIKILESKEILSKTNNDIIEIKLKYCDSKRNFTIRFADFIANTIYCCHELKKDIKAIEDFTKIQYNESKYLIIHYFPNKKNSPIK